MGKNKKAKNNLVFLIFKVLFVIAVVTMSIILTKYVIKLDMLPNKYFALYCIILGIINIIVLLGSLTKKIVVNIITIVLAISLIAGSCIAINHINKIDRFLDIAFNNIKTEVTTYSVVVLNDSNYEKIEDLDKKIIGYVTLDTKKDSYKNIFKDIVNVELKEFDNSYDMYDELSNNKIDAMIINDIYLEFLKDEDSKIKKKIKVIYSFDIEDEVVSINDEHNSEQVFNVLITGSDSRNTSKIQAKTRSDVNMIMTVNTQTHEILLTSIPRDYYVQLHGTIGVKDKLTHSGIYGMNMTKTTIEDLLNIKIDYVVKVRFGTVINVVDTIGGIDIDADQDVYTHCGDGGAVKTQVKKGWNHFNGAQALSYARERKGYTTGDNHRVQNQQQVIEAIFTKVMTDKSLLSNYEEVLNSLSSLYVTDIPSSLIKKTVKQQLTDMKSWKIERQQLSGEGKMGVETYSMPGWKLWVMYPNQASVNKNSKRINDMIKGKKLEEI